MLLGAKLIIMWLCAKHAEIQPNAPVQKLVTVESVQRNPQELFPVW